MIQKSILIIIIMIFFIGCSKEVQLPNISNVQKNLENEYIIKNYKEIVEYQDVNKTNIKMPDINEENSYGVKVTSELKIAYENYLLGDGQTALNALNIAQKQKDDLLYSWQISFLKVKVLMMMGLDADAMIELEKCETLELKVFNHNLNSIALRGEINVMEGDFLIARKNFYKVLNRIGDWELPVSYSMPPSNIKELVAVTTAQLRALTGIAASYLMEENYKKAYLWSSEAEKRFNAVHFVSNHFLYGAYLKTHLDSYYGRAMNMAILASSILALNNDIKNSDLYYDRAFKFFDSINYKKGKIITYALKAKAFLYNEDYEKSLESANKAIDIALESNMYDFIWRIEMLKGKAYVKEDELEKAKNSFKNAANVVDLVSGELQNDFSKRRFGIGKGDIVYELMQINLDENSLKELFLNVEQGRARAFVDLMRNKAINKNNFNEELFEIKALDKKIKQLSLLNNIKDEKLLREKREILVKKLFDKSPKSASIVSSLSYGIDDVQKKLDKNEAIVYFLPVKNYENIQYLLIEKNSLSLKEFNLTPTQLTNLLSDYLNSLENYYEGKQSVSSTNLNELNKKITLKNINKKRLYIVGSGSTSYIPWYGLDNDADLSVIPSVSTLFFKNEVISSSQNIVVGDPFFADKMQQLKGAREEAIKIAKYYGIKPLIYKEATFSNLQNSSRNRVNILHLATHGVFDYKKPMDSSIFLSQNNDLFTWSAKDILKDEIKANLVILSACKTGLGKNSEGDDLLGIPRSFFLGGSKAVLSSLWPVDDEKTEAFMLQFHKYANDGKYANALKRTVKIFKEKGYDLSVYGAFILYGTDLN